MKGEPEFPSNHSQAPPQSVSVMSIYLFFLFLGYIQLSVCYYESSLGAALWFLKFLKLWAELSLEQEGPERGVSFFPQLPINFGGPQKLTCLIKKNADLLLVSVHQGGVVPWPVLMGNYVVTCTPGKSPQAATWVLKLWEELSWEIENNKFKAILC